MTKPEYIEYFRSYITKQKPGITITVEADVITTVDSGLVQIGYPVKCPGPPECKDADCKGWVMMKVTEFRKVF